MRRDDITPPAAHTEDAINAAVAREHGEQRNMAHRNTIALLASRLIVAVLGWSGTVLIARHLSPDDWGVFSFVFGLLGMMSIVTDLGVGRVVLARLLDADPDEAEKVASSFVSLRAVLGLIGYGIAVGYVFALGYSAEVVQATALAGLVVIIATPSHALSVLYQSRLKLVIVATAEGFAQLVQLILTIIIAVSEPTLLFFILPAIANELFSGTWKLVGVRRGWIGPRITARPSWRLWREMLVEAVPLSVGLAMVTLLSKVDILMLAQLDKFNSVGLYTVAYKFADLASYGVLAVLTPVATLLVAAWPVFPDEFRHRARSAGVAVGLLCCFALCAMWASADRIVGLLYGARFAETGNATRMLLVGAVFAGLSQLILVVLVSAGRQRTYPWVALGALAMNIALNFVLIPGFSYNGSAFATVLTELAMFMVMWLLVRKSVEVRRLLPAGRLALLGGLTVVVCVLSQSLRMVAPWPVATAVAIVLFAVGAVGLRLVDRGAVVRVLRHGARKESQ